ncbi:ornithine cyclodeaminase family protein [Pseudonocardia spinosispora]|uniref:ornithine cyclodeaminase family protein n=1 Tax=Pseudonocardia spinosispora TaxID=103441 RepID=UPI0004299049|nr:ornithine cyclodeaminase family protein [Pseudonocardia spinosispora]
MLILSDSQVGAALGWDEAIASQREAFEALGRGTAQLAEKAVLPNPADGSVALCYVSRLSPGHGAVCKFVDVHPGNAALSLPTISATVLVLDATTGRLAAVLDGRTLTEIRTAAGSAVAADALAPHGVDELAVLGCGVQGRAHVRALARVRPLKKVRMWSPSPRRREDAAAALRDELGLDVVASSSASDAVRAAPLVVTCTLSHSPVLSVEHLLPGATVISVGSFEPHRSEVPPELLRAARVVVDDVATSLGHAGPVVMGLSAGDLRETDLVSLGEVLTGAAVGRTDPAELVFYNSVGLGIQDAAAAHAVLATLPG